MKITLDDPAKVIEFYAILHESEDCVVVYVNAALKPSLAFSGPEVYISSCTLRIEDFSDSVTSFGEASRYEVYLTFLKTDKVIEAINRGRGYTPIQS